MDTYLFPWVCEAFGGHDARCASANYWATGALALCAGAASAHLAYRLRPIARVLAVLQVNAISLLAVWLLWNCYAIAVLPVALLSSAWLALAGASALKWVSQREQRHKDREYELLLRNRELQEARAQIVKQDEMTRRMLAADLHDQVLNGLKLIKERFRQYQSSRRPQEAAHIEAQLMDVMAEIREVMDTLSPSVLEHLGFSAAVDDYLRNAASKAAVIPRFRDTLNGRSVEKLNAVEQILLYRIIQEAINNACKHSAAALLQVSQRLEGGQLLIEVMDDGKGMGNTVPGKDCRGIRYMKLRADLIGAKISWRCLEDIKGTVVEIRFNTEGRSNAQGTDS